MCRNQWEGKKPTLHQRHNADKTTICKREREREENKMRFWGTWDLIDKSRSGIEMDRGRFVISDKKMF